MINPRELRLGNIFYQSLIGSERSLAAFGNAKDLQLILDNPEKFEPIILTEEWITKFGLSLTEWFGDNFLIVKDNDFGWYITVRNASRTKKIDFIYIRYVHQLQNIYYDLTGIELITK